MGGLSRVQVYVLARTLEGIAAAMFVITAMIMLINFVELSRTVGGSVDLGFAELSYLTLLKSPFIILILLPFVFLFGTLAAFADLNRRSELVAMRAAGVSAWRFILPAAATAFLVGVLTVTVLNPAASLMNGRFEDRRAELVDKPSPLEAGDMWLRQGDNRNQIVIHARSHDTVGGTLRLMRVSFFIQSIGPRGQLVFTRRIEAASATLSPGSWRLNDVSEATPGARTVRSQQLTIPTRLDRRTAIEKFASPDAVPFWRLPSMVRDAQLAGFSPTRYRLRYQQLLATPLLFAAMAILAAASSLRLARLGGLVGVAIGGVTLGFLVFFVNQLCGALATAEVIPAAVAAWATPMLALLSGVALLCYTEDG